MENSTAGRPSLLLGHSPREYNHGGEVDARMHLASRSEVKPNLHSSLGEGADFQIFIAAFGVTEAESCQDTTAITWGTLGC